MKECRLQAGVMNDTSLGSHSSICPSLPPPLLCMSLLCSLPQVFTHLSLSCLMLVTPSCRLYLSSFHASFISLFLYFNFCSSFPEFFIPSRYSPSILYFSVLFFLKLYLLFVFILLLYPGLLSKHFLILHLFVLCSFLMFSFPLISYCLNLVLNLLLFILLSFLRSLLISSGSDFFFYPPSSDFVLLHLFYSLSSFSLFILPALFSFCALSASFYNQ